MKGLWGLEGGLSTGDFEGWMKGLWGRGGGLSTGDFESWMKGLWGWGISLSLSRGSVEGVSRKAPLLGNPKDYVFERYVNAL
jgi:hypothetical protein